MTRPPKAIPKIAALEIVALFVKWKREVDIELMVTKILPRENSKYQLLCNKMPNWSSAYFFVVIGMNDIENHANTHINQGYLKSCTQHEKSFK